ncbi:MAG: DUF456 domain-containing protein, partial [Kiritimatiellae bacterium]|nr:DUF456 domain-containing protein [Kiritimatiellia bacterium]
LLPVVPGPLIAYAALWLPLAFGLAAPPAHLAAGAAVVVAVSVVDYVLPAFCARRFHCSRWGVAGCVAGGVAGLFFLPWGVVVGPFAGTVVGELVAGRALAESLKGGVGSLLGFVVCLALKGASVALFAWWYFQDVFMI